MRVHRRRDVEDGERLVLVEALGQRHAVLLVVDPLLRKGVPNPKVEAAEQLSVQAARVHHRADVADPEEVDQVGLAGLEVDLHLRETNDERPGVAVVPVVVFRDTHEAEAGQRRCRGPGHRVDVIRQAVSIEVAAECDGARGGLGVGEAARRVAGAEDAHAAEGVVVG